MDPAEERALIRRSLADADDRRDRSLAPDGRGGAAYLGRVYDGGAIPTVVPRVFLTHPVEFDVADAAGATPVAHVGVESVPVLVLGPTVPAVDDDLTALQIEGLWVAAMGGYPSTPSTPCTPCAIPRVDLNLALTYRIGPGAGAGSASIPLRYVPAGTCPGGIQTPDGLVTGTDYWLADGGGPICTAVGGFHGHTTIADWWGFSTGPHADQYFLLACRPIISGGTAQVILVHYVPRIFGGPMRQDYQMATASDGFSCTPFLFNSKVTTGEFRNDRVIISVL